uniref:flavodoxin-dependent (E)-4-hydroxy-3-methylbut-2-enyl-diphosphate synthase n=1 Tax=Oribacterium sinus TaxID=237576 RepID=UPI0028D39922
MFKREDTRVVEVGKLKIGGGNPVVLQSMCNTKTEDIKGSIAQVQRLAEAGCELIRLTVPTKEAAYALKEIKAASPIPVVADIHFDYRMAILAMENGADKIRINPGNIGSRERL